MSVMVERPRAACVGQWELFDSLHPADHLEAAAICETCPLIESCLTLLEQVQRETAGTAKAGGGPGGTWAGKLVGAPKAKRGPAKPREHGTTRGYYQHKTRKEDPCRECRSVMRQSLDARLKAKRVASTEDCEHHDRETRSRWDNESGARGTLVTSPGTSTSVQTLE